MSDHEHCRNCVFKKCSNTKRCPIVSCEYGCEMKLHECKMVDHSFLCQNKKVPCVNTYYGCSKVLPRSQLGYHIQNCPASVIQCTHEWGRNPLYSQDRLRWVPFEQPNPSLVKGYLDVELALHDQKVINQMIQGRYKHGVARKCSERHDPNDRLSYERAKCFQEEIKSAEIVADNFLMDPKSMSLENSKLKKIVASEMVSSPSTDEVTNGPINEFVRIPECPSFPDTRSGLGLNLNIEMTPKFGRHSYLYKIPCGQVLHRREFPSHFKNVHAEIQGGLGWIEQRCPMAQYGCPFVHYPLLPSTQESRIVFNQNLGVFGVKPVKNTNHGPNSSALLCLPSELVEEICKWLDGFSLNNLMQTCTMLYHNLSHLVNKQGVVMTGWKKRVYEDGSTSWTMSTKVWSFTKAFSEVHRWVYSDVPGVHIHFEKCSFYEKYTPERPFQYAPHPSMHCKSMRNKGNEHSNLIWEKQVPLCYRRPDENAPQVLREQWIRSKYERMEFIEGAPTPTYLTGEKQGMVWKKEKDSKNWNQRRVVLSTENNSFAYYIRPTDTDAKDMWLLSKINAIFADEKTGRQNCLQVMNTIDGKTRSLFISTDSGKEIVEWYMAIRYGKLKLMKDRNPDADEEELASQTTMDFTREGQVWKRGPRDRNSWKDRWLSLDGRRVMYFKEPTDAFAKGEIVLGTKDEGYEVTSGFTEHEAPSGYGFEIKVPVPAPAGRKYEFSSASEEERDEWVRVLNSIISMSLSAVDKEAMSTNQDMAMRKINNRSLPRKLSIKAGIS